MKKQTGKLRALVLGVLLVLVLSVPAFASDDDNSLYDLGVKTEGAVVSPEFQYGVSTYTVMVPAGTKELAIEPVASNPNATITGISGTTLNEDGTGTVTITVQAPNGDSFPYTLRVEVDPTSVIEPETQPQTEKVTEAPKVVETEPETETENLRYVSVPRDTVDQAERTIRDLQDEIVANRDQLNKYVRIIYGLIAGCVVLFFMVINLFFRKRDLKAEVKEYRSLGYTTQKQQKKAQKKAVKEERKEQKKAPKAQNNVKGAKAPQQGVPSGNMQPGRGRMMQQGAAAPNMQQRPQRVNQPGVPVGEQGAVMQRQMAEPQDRNVYYDKAPIDVMPQTSRKARKLPEYENMQQDSAMNHAGSAPAPNAPVNQPVNTPQPVNEEATVKAPAESVPENAVPVKTPPERPRRADKDVEIDMIDL